MAIKVEALLGTRVAETILASGHVRPHTKAAHMDASDPVKISAENACKWEPSTYGPTRRALFDPAKDLDQTVAPSRLKLEGRPE